VNSGAKTRRGDRWGGSRGAIDGVGREGRPMGCGDWEGESSGRRVGERSSGRG